MVMKIAYFFNLTRKTVSLDVKMLVAVDDTYSVHGFKK